MTLATRKRCSKCKQKKPLSDFASDNSHKTARRQRYCRECNRKYNKRRNRRWKKEDPKSYREYQRTRYQRRKGHKAAYAKTYREKYPERVRARRKLNYEVERGRITRPTACPKCGATDRRIEAHHKDYSKPLDVEWMCSQCHAEVED